MAEYIEREIVEKARLDIINRMEGLKNEWERISKSNIDTKYTQFYSGRADGIEIGQRIVKIVLEDILSYPNCEAKMDGKKEKKRIVPRCRKCVYEMCCSRDKDNDNTCTDYKRDPPDGGYYG